ncbi:MAG TPA: response regulator [Chloroflexota bacterium]|nr:response regulator [Chloroflexota bacterium]
MAETRIVVVEDNAAIAHLIQEVLDEVPGYRTVRAETGAQALRTIPAQHPNLVILDVDLPDIDGFTVYDQLHRCPDTATIPCLMMSATQHNDALRQRGITDFLAKPFDLDDLLAHVANLVHIA